MIVSIETPVAKGDFLRACVDSVLAQTDDRWRLSLWWDGGDDSSRNFLETLAASGHSSIEVRFGERRGIAGARRALTAASRGEYILPLDDDDCLTSDAVAAFLDAAERAPWAGIIRARREFIDENGRSVEEREWFPFTPRRYQQGMTVDPFNHAQPTLIQRNAYDRTEGWHGFAEYGGAGEDCDLVARIEEVAEVVLLDRCLYRYRLHPRRASHALGRSAAEDMWRRIADASLRRRGLALDRVNAEQPYHYARRPRAPIEPAKVVSVRVGSGPDAARAVAEGRGRTFCLLDASVPGSEAPTVQALAGSLLAADADLVAAVVSTGPSAADDAEPPACVALLARAELWRAMPGPDAGCASAGAVLADVVMRARMRGFDCRLVEWRAPASTIPHEDHDRLARRWQSLRAPLRADSPGYPAQSD